MDLAELDRAEALARAGHAEAAQEYERVGDLRRERDDGVGALVAYGAAIAFGSTHGLDVASKLRVEDKRAAVAQGFTDVQQVLAGAARALGSHPADAPGHRALCPGCGALKPVVWLPCTQCRTPHNPLSGAVGLLVSERVRSVEELETLGGAMRAGAQHDVPLDVARVVDELLAPPSQGESPFAGERVPGTIVTANFGGRNAVILGVGATSDQGASKPEFLALAERAARALLTADDHPDELVDADGQSIREQRRALERRIGERIAFESWRRVSVSSGGCIGTASIPYAIPIGHYSPPRVKLAGNRAAALVALEAGDDARSLPARSFEGQLAAHGVEDTTRALALLAFAGQLAMHYALFRRITSAETSSVQLGRFEAAPYVSVTEAIEVMSELVGTALELTVIERFERPLIDEHDPDTFPSEAAKRA